MHQNCRVTTLTLFWNPPAFRWTLFTVQVNRTSNLLWAAWCFFIQWMGRKSQPLKYVFTFYRQFKRKMCNFQCKQFIWGDSAWECFYTFFCFSEVQLCPLTCVHIWGEDPQILNIDIAFNMKPLKESFRMASTLTASSCQWLAAVGFLIPGGKFGVSRVEVIT